MPQTLAAYCLYTHSTHCETTVIKWNNKQQQKKKIICESLYNITTTTKKK